MFSFFDMVGTYEDRKVDCTPFSWGFVSTARVNDGRQPYETAVQSNEYGTVRDLKKTNEMIIVEAYDNSSDAQEGHDKWCKVMEEDPPFELIDCLNAEITRAESEAGREFTEIRIRST